MFPDPSPSKQTKALGANVQICVLGIRLKFWLLVGWGLGRAMACSLEPLGHTRTSADQGTCGGGGRPLFTTDGSLRLWCETEEAAGVVAAAVNAASADARATHGSLLRQHLYSLAAKIEV